MGFWLAYLTSLSLSSMCTSGALIPPYQWAGRTKRDKLHNTLGTESRSNNMSSLPLPLKQSHFLKHWRQHNLFYWDFNRKRNSVFYIIPFKKIWLPVESFSVSLLLKITKKFPEHQSNSFKNKIFYLISLGFKKPFFNETSYLSFTEYQKTQKAKKTKI